VMALLSSCQGLMRPEYLTRPEYMTDLQHLELICSSIGQEEFTSALAENNKLERRYDEAINGSDDYTRVILVSAQMNASLLKKVIQNEKTFSLLFEEVDQQSVIITQQKSAIDKLSLEQDRVKLTLEQDRVKALLKKMEDLEAENKTLRQQIKDFKKIDLEGDKINSGT